MEPSGAHRGELGLDDAGGRSDRDLGPPGRGHDGFLWLGRASAAEQNGGHEILNFYDLKIPYPGDGVASTKAYVASHHDVVVKFLAGYVNAIAYIKAHPDESKQVMAKYLKNDDKAALDATYDALVQVLPDKPVPDPAGLQTILDSVDGGQGKNPADFMDPEPMQAALKLLGK